MWILLTGICAGLGLWCVKLLASAADPTLLLRGITAGLGIVTFVCVRRARTRTPDSAGHGSAGFAASDEVADLIVPMDARLAPGSVLLGTTGDHLLALPLALARQHGVIVGGSGTGKSFSFFLPNAAFARATSLVATDPKSELWKRASGFHRSARYAPTDPDASACLNWIPLCSNPRIAELCARAIVTAGGNTQEPPWQDLEAAFLASLFAHTATLSVPTPLTAYTLLTNADAETLVAQFLASASQAAREQANIFLQTHERMRGSITPVLASKLQFMRDPLIARFTSASLATPDFGRLRISPEAVFWCMEEQDIVRLRPLSAIFFTLLLEQLAVEGKNAAADVPIVCLLDEFANIGIIPNYASVISLSRGRGIALWHGIQSLSQLEETYGKPTAQTILANCATKVTLSGADVDTADYFSRSLGPKTEATPRRSFQRRRFAFFAGSVSDTIQEFARPLLTVDEIRRIETTRALVITGNRRPLLIDKYHYDIAPQTATTTALGEACFLPVLPTAAKAPSVTEPTKEKELIEVKEPVKVDDDPPPAPPASLGLFRVEEETPEKTSNPSRRRGAFNRRAHSTWLKSALG